MKFFGPHRPERVLLRRNTLYVTFIIRYLARQVSHTRHFPCATSITSIDQASRVDAQASSERTGIGGWLPELDSNGRPSPSTSRWFSHAITKEEFPWVFERGGNLRCSSLRSKHWRSSLRSRSSSWPKAQTRRS